MLQEYQILSKFIVFAFSFVQHGFHIAICFIFFCNQTKPLANIQLFAEQCTEIMSWQQNCFIRFWNGLILNDVKVIMMLNLVMSLI